jgi:branched-subunit amino acid transport protein AzlD
MIKLNKLLSKLPIHPKWGTALKTIPFVAAIVLLKFGAHYLGFEFLTMSSLFTAIVSANIFLIGFLLSGTLSDYKESEKLPGDLSASLETMADEGLIIYKNKNSQEAKAFILKLAQFNQALVNWFYRTERTESLMQRLRSFNDDFLAFESQTQANFIARLKQEQNAIRRMITRIHTIRETSFIGAGYAIAEIITFILVVGLIFIKMDPFYESVFFVSFVSFILIYMIYFIKDIDDPFEYDDESSLDDEVSLTPLILSQRRIESYCKDLS